ncbi:MAG: hypothetical protein U1F55_11495 [Chitinivorax sp.]
MTLPSSWPGYTRANALRGLLIYSSGDSIAALLLGEFSLTRLAVIALLGSTVYALEIPNWFYQVDRMVPPGGTRAALLRTLLALAYFNPLWVARHMALIGWASSGTLPGWSILAIASHAFALNIPASTHRQPADPEQSPALALCHQRAVFGVDGGVLRWGGCGGVGSGRPGAHRDWAAGGAGRQWQSGLQKR